MTAKHLPPLKYLSLLWSTNELSTVRPLEGMVLFVLPSSMYDGGRLKLVRSDFTFNDLASLREFVCTGERGVNSGEERLKDDGGGVDIGKLEGVLPAAAFFSI